MSLQERFKQRRAFIFCMFFAAVMGVLSAVVGNNLMWPEASVILLMAALLLDITGMVILAYQMTQERKNSLHAWALEEAERQEIMQLRGNTPEELHRMLDYHLKTGNIKEADAISHKLLAVVDTENALPDELADHQSIKIDPDNGAAQGADKGLPEWITSAEEKRKAKNLPQWMQ